MITITADGIEKQVPTRWQEVNFEMFVKLTEAGSDVVKVFSAILDMPEETLRNAKLSNVEDVITSISFIGIIPENRLPETIIGYKIPKDLGFETIGQYEDIRQDMDQILKLDPAVMELEQLKRYPLYCATYACSQKYGSYDWEKAEYMVEEFMKAPALEVLAVGNFTWVKFVGLNKGKTNLFRNRITRMMKLKQGLKAYLKTLVS